MFRKDYSIKGKHADYMRELTGNKDDKEEMTPDNSLRVFDHGYQVLLIAPLIGVAYDLRVDVDKTNSRDFTVKAIQMIRNQPRFEEIYRMVLLAERITILTLDERVNYVFRPEEDEKEKAEELFSSYTRGGIEWLYNSIAKNGKTADSYLDNMISVISEFATEFGVCRDMESKVNEIEESYF